MHDYENFIYVLDNKRIHLSILENEMLNILIENKKSLVTYESISERLYNIKCDKYARACIAGIIYRLREKGIKITTIEGFGHMII